MKNITPIHLSKNSTLSIWYFPDSGSGTLETLENKPGRSPCLQGTDALERKIDNKCNKLVSCKCFSYGADRLLGQKEKSVHVEETHRWRGWVSADCCIKCGHQGEPHWGAAVWTTLWRWWNKLSRCIFWGRTCQQGRGKARASSGSVRGPVCVGLFLLYCI